MGNKNQRTGTSFGQNTNSAVTRTPSSGSQSSTSTNRNTASPTSKTAPPPPQYDTKVTNARLISHLSDIIISPRCVRLNMVRITTDSLAGKVIHEKTDPFGDCNFVQFYQVQSYEDRIEFMKGLTIEIQYGALGFGDLSGFEKVMDLCKLLGADFWDQVKDIVVSINFASDAKLPAQIDTKSKDYLEPNKLKGYLKEVLHGAEAKVKVVIQANGPLRYGHVFFAIPVAEICEDWKLEFGAGTRTVRVGGEFLHAFNVEQTRVWAKLINDEKTDYYGTITSRESIFKKGH